MRNFNTLPKYFDQNEMTKYTQPEQTLMFFDSHNVYKNDPIKELALSIRRIHQSHPDEPYSLFRVFTLVALILVK